jgi:hypothetical protein
MFTPLPTVPKVVGPIATQFFVFISWKIGPLMTYDIKTYVYEYNINFKLSKSLLRSCGDVEHRMPKWNMASLVLSRQSSDRSSSRRHVAASRSVLSHAKNTANQLKIQAAIGAYEEMEMSVDGDKARRNSVKAFLKSLALTRTNSIMS